MTLLHAFKYGGRFELARSVAPFLAMQLAKLQWPLPDLLVPIPQTWGHRLLRGYNPSYLLAEELGRLLQIPCVNALKRRGVERPQSVLGKRERSALSAHTFVLKSNKVINRRVLLIDDVCTTGKTLLSAAERLYEGAPKSVHALALCIAY